MGRKVKKVDLTVIYKDPLSSEEEPMSLYAGVEHNGVLYLKHMGLDIGLNNLEYVVINKRFVKESNICASIYEPDVYYDIYYGYKDEVQEMSPDSRMMPILKDYIAERKRFFREFLESTRHR